MNILYFTLDDFDSLIHYHSINTDLLRVFQRCGHKVYVISPSERKKGFPTREISENGVIILKPRVGNMQKTSIIEKGISTITVGWLLTKAIKKYLNDVKFNLVLYCTPPITFLSAIRYVKKRDDARTYLLLKDIFPQNAVDIGLMKTTGIKGMLYKHFRNQEKKLYQISNYIGCMSQANVDYIIQHNPEIDSGNVEICPNSIDVTNKSVDSETRNLIRQKYDIPVDKKVFVYGGNLGKPQGIPFLIDCLRACQDIQDVFFLIVGDGTEYHMLNNYIKKEEPVNVKLMNRLPKEHYDWIIASCDVGMIFLDHRFTIPNFPSRLLSYMQAKLPVLACTDPNTDIGKVVVDNGFGWWCESNSIDDFCNTMRWALKSLNGSALGENAYRFLESSYSVEYAYETIMKRL